MGQYEARYLTKHASLGASFGVLTLLARWIGPDTVFFSSDMLMHYGLVGMIVYIILHACTFMIFGWIANIARKKWPTKLTIGDMIVAQAESKAQRVLLLIIVAASLLTLIIQGFIIHHMFQVLFTIPVPVTLFLFFFFCFLYAGMWGMNSILKAEPFKIAIIFAAIIFIPVYVFVQKGIAPIYNGVRLYHPYLLYWKDYSSLFFLTTSILVVFGMVIIDRVSWQRLFILQPNKVRTTFSLMGLVYSTIPLALLSLFIISLSNKGYDQAGNILFELIYKLDSPGIVALFVVFCLVIATSTVGAELNALTVLLVKHFSPNGEHTDTQQYRQSRAIAGVLTLLVFISSVYATKAIIPLMLLYGIIGAAMIIPMMIIIFGKQRLPAVSMYGILFSLSAGFIVFAAGYMLGAIWTSFILSAFFCFVAYQIASRDA
ncbi:hypothetical protein [Lentibacillus saliphilus]|uniref:hypothetical protein n=1 Tax=Lentibacillus saliphilus TaxID=2737028 RepID=UPI001C3017C6|nr:hypothetical protein [Lentibacillus saliphilus]